MNNLYNNEQRFARISPLRGPCRPRVAARETTCNNASPRTRFLLVVLAKLFHFMALFLAMAKHERARFCAWLIESVACCFPYSARWHFSAAKAIFCSKSRMDQKKIVKDRGATRGWRTCSVCSPVYRFVLFLEYFCILSILHYASCSFVLFLLFAILAFLFATYSLSFSFSCSIFPVSSYSCVFLLVSQNVTS